MSAQQRQDGDYSPPVLAPARGGPVPAWNPPVTVDNGQQEQDATAGAPPVTDGDPGNE